MGRARPRPRVDVVLAPVERLIATLLSVYVLAAFVLAGSGLGAAILWYYNEI